MLSNSEIRAKAREMLKGSLFSHEWLFTAIMVVIISVILSILGATGIGILAAGIIGFATAGYFLHFVRNQIKAEDFMDGVESVKKDFVGSFVVGLIYNLGVGIGYSLMIIPGIIFEYLFAFIYLVRHDNPEMDFIECFKESYRLMKGHVIQFFLLRLSFIGWMLLGMLCFGVGTYWVVSYMNVADVIFYEEVLKADKENA